MVNYNPYLDESTPPPPIVSQSVLFNLSKPIDFLNFGQARIKLPTKNNESINFTFLEPFKSCHVGSYGNSDDNTNKFRYNTAHGDADLSGGGKLSTKMNATRQQPYTLSKPVTTKADLEKSSSSNTNNGIISRLSSISSTFKSIFVRPKNSKLVNLSSINNKKTPQQTQQDNTLTTNPNQTASFKLNLFSTISTNNDNDDQRNEVTRMDDEFKISTKLEKIISRNVQKESYSSHLIRIENQLNDTDDEKCLPSSASSSSSSSSSSSTIFSSSTASNLTTASSTTNSVRKMATSEAHQRAMMMTNSNSYNSTNNTNVFSSAKSTPSKPPTNTTSTESKTNTKSLNGLNSKWTCLVCLSMHKLDVRVCSICGSLQHSTTTATSRSTHLNSSLAAKNSTTNRTMDLSSSNFEHDASSSTLLKSININKNQSYLSKTWTCMHCSFANDCLKIVCMNCRSSKLQQQLEQENNNDSKLNLSKQHHALQIKRKTTNTQSQKPTNGSSSNTNNLKSSSIKQQNTSNEENEFDGKDDDDDYSSGRNASKKSKCENCCSNCTKEKSLPNTNKQEINEKESPASIQKPKNPLINSLSNENRILITPIKPVGYANLDAMLDSDTTLVQKSTDVSSGSSATTTTIAASFAQETQFKNGNIFAKTSNWTCSTCLVSNDESKLSCACCATPKPSPAIDNNNTSKVNQKLSFDQVDANASAKPSSFFASNTNTATTSATSKWTCSTCLVSNDANKDECACCMTKRANEGSNSVAKKDEQETTKTKFASLVAAAGSFSNFNSGPLNTSISFGLKPSANPASEPIKFGSSSVSGSGFSFGSTKTVTANTNIPAAVSTFGVNQDKPQQSLEISSPSKIAINSSKSEATTNNETTIKFGFLGGSSSTNSAVNSSSGFNTNVVNNGISTGISSFSSKSEAPAFAFGAAPSTELKSESGSKSMMPVPGQSTAMSFFGNSTKQEATTSASTPFAFGSNSNVNNNNTSSSFLSNPFVKPNEAQKNENNNNIPSSFSTGSISNNTTNTPSLFQFGFSKSSNQIAVPAQASITTTPAAPSFFTTTNTSNNGTNSGFGFGNSSSKNAVASNDNGFPKETPVAAQTSFFGNGFGSASTSSNSEKSNNSTPFMFGSNNSTTIAPTTANSTTTNSNNNNVFGALLTSATSNNQTPASPFSFGKTTAVPAAPSNLPQPFVFGSNQVSNTSNTMSSNGSNGFNFGAVPSTPTTNNIIPGSNQSSPFVFSGIGGAQGVGNTNTDSPNLQQVLTPSTRLIKKPTRRIKK